MGLVTTTVTREATKLIEPRRSMAKADELVLRRTLSHAPTRGIGGLCVGPGALPSCSPANPPSRKGGAHARAEGALELRGGATARAEGALRARDRGGLRRPRGSLCDGTEGVPVLAPRGRSSKGTPRGRQWSTEGVPMEWARGRAEGAPAGPRRGGAGWCAQHTHTRARAHSQSAAAGCCSLDSRRGGGGGHLVLGQVSIAYRFRLPS